MERSVLKQLFGSTRQEAAPPASAIRTSSVPATTPPYEFVGSVLSDVGCVRTINEDQVRMVDVRDEAVLADRGVLLLVADGIGGNRAGDVASQIAIDTLHSTYYDALGSPREALIRAFEAANHAIYAIAENHPRFAGMGTTGTALVLCGDRAFSGNVGDSRIYLVRDQCIHRMTSDDSVVGELVSKGLLSPADARHHAEKNIILRAIGTSPTVTVSTWDEPFPIRAGDRYLLCSDGLHDLVDDEEIREAVERETPVESCAHLVALARSRGGHDNIAVVVVHVNAHSRR